MLFWILAIIAITLVFAALPRPALNQKGTGSKPVPRPIRGTWIVRDDQGRQLWVEALAKNALDPHTLVPFGNGYLLPESESKHLKIIGTTGTGKSTAIKQLLARVAERPPQRVVLPDPDGGYARLFYQPDRGDRIVCPFDARDVGWDMAADVTQPYHPDELAAALLPTKSGEAAEWSHYGQQLVSATIAALRARHELTVETLYQSLMTTPPEEYATLVAGSPAAAFFRPDNERMRGSIESVVATAVAGLQYMRHGTLSLSQYAQSNTDRGWIFITYKAEQISALRNVIATMMRVVIFSLMSRPEGDSGTWLVVDELDALGKITGLPDALTRLRKFGGRCVLAFQSLGPLVDIYGQGIASALVENCGSTLLLRSSAGTTSAVSTSAFAAGLIGKREVLRTTKQTNKSSGSNLAWGSLARLAPTGSRNTSTGTTTARQVEDAVLPSQIEQLEDLHAYVHSHDSPFWSKCTLSPFTEDPVTEAFVPRETRSMRREAA